jgi:hypothetical protein
LLCSADKARQLDWKLVGVNAFGGAQWWKIIAKVGMAQLYHPLAPRKIP